VVIESRANSSAASSGCAFSNPWSARWLAASSFSRRTWRPASRAASWRAFEVSLSIVCLSFVPAASALSS
jgi:hypothetical protein